MNFTYKFTLKGTATDSARSELLEILINHSPSVCHDILTYQFEKENPDIPPGLSSPLCKQTLIERLTFLACVCKQNSLLVDKIVAVISNFHL